MKCLFQGHLSEQLTEHRTLTGACLIFWVFVAAFDEIMAGFRFTCRVIVTCSDVSENLTA
jgi:hypothetical protein